MSFALQFINEYGTTILYSILVALAGYLGIVAKNLYTKWFDTKMKREAARECVKFAEQAYKTLHGEEKFQKALEAAEEMLAEKGIQVTDLEMRVLIEAALAEFNDAFNRTNPEEGEDNGRDEVPCEQ